MNAPSVATPNTSSVLAKLKNRRAAQAAAPEAPAAPTPPAETGPINPTEASLPPAPPVGTPAETAAKPTRVRRTKAQIEAAAAEAAAAAAAPVGAAVSSHQPGLPQVGVLAENTPPAVFVPTTEPEIISCTPIVRAAFKRAEELCKLETDLDKLTRLIALFGVR